VGVGHDSVVIARGKDGDIRAFHNTCRHRGSRICREEQGMAARSCAPTTPGPTISTGRCAPPPSASSACINPGSACIAVPLKNVAGLLFVALGDQSVSFEQAAADMAEKMQHQGLEEAKLAKSVRYTVKANWKLIFENNRECYHCTTAHPEYTAAPTTRRASRPSHLPRSSGRSGSRPSASRGWGWATRRPRRDDRRYWRAARSPLVEGWKTQSLDGSRSRR
jgi:Rieske 2Fe-2S family protein